MTVGPPTIAPSRRRRNSQVSSAQQMRVAASQTPLAARCARLELLCTGAAWYNLVGRQTANGETLDTVTATAAHRSLPLDSYAKVTDIDNGRSVVVKINDRGPYTPGRILDLSPLAADALEMKRVGVAAVVVEPLVNQIGPVAD